MENNRSPLDTEIDIGQITTHLKAENLGGMPAPLELIVAERRVETIGQLIAVLGEKNPYGHFQLETENVTRAREIMGTGNEQPIAGSYGIIIDRNVVHATIEALLTMPPEEDTEEEPIAA